VLGRQQVGAKTPATSASGWGKAHLLGSLLHKPVMSNLISLALIVAREAPDFGLMLNALLRRHQLPAARISLVGAPGAPEGVSRANHAEKQKESKGLARGATYHYPFVCARRNAALRGLWST
jgi:hypothetical protein